MIVVPEPSRGEVLDLVDVIEQILRKPLISNCSIETFDICILLRLPRLDVVDPDATLLRPVLQRGAYVFGSVITSNGER